MKERAVDKRENEDLPVTVETYHVVYTEKHGYLPVKFPPDLSEEQIIRITVGELPGGMLIVNLYTEPDFGYAYNVSYPEFSEWGYLPA